MKQKHYEVVIVGGGISGCALFYSLANFTDIKRAAIIEKYEGIATLNTKGHCNSQTIHCGDIETNYSKEKAANVAKIAKMTVNYGLKYNYNEKFMFSHQKMVLGVGEKEVNLIKSRYEDLKEIYPYLQLFDKEKLKQIEPNVVFDLALNERKEEIIAMGVEKGEYTTIDYGAISDSLVKNAKNIGGEEYELYLNSEVKDIKKIGDTFYIKTKNNLSITANFVVVDAGTYSLYLAHKMGYGLHLSTLPIAGSFYFSKRKILNGKVYTVQNDKLPFAALHGDPDILAGEKTRFGPTAFAIPKLERYKNLDSFFDFFETLKLDKKVIDIFWNLLKDKDIRDYSLRNLLFELPLLNKKAFTKDARKIVPSLKDDELYYAKEFGGVRPQVIDKQSERLEFGQGKINTDDGIVFNMTPSPGATSCFETARVDIEKICEFLGKNFDTEKFNDELYD
ncbi:FAD-dependent oxidoreductase [Campylobacter pinnipediorum]|uniref:FAD-dependent oxidoreductase n=1 Tax=Campylobacter pinnipediorum TaxID=1965231 RepID=UPI00084DBC15|nr:FAD-dependent oxidoreductase [Campylobacter pinnipediorum]